MYKIREDASYPLDYWRPREAKYDNWKAKQENPYKKEDSDNGKQRHQILNLFHDQIGFQEYIRKRYSELDLSGKIQTAEPLSKDMISLLAWFQGIVRNELNIDTDKPNPTQDSKNHNLHLSLAKTLDGFVPFSHGDFINLRSSYAAARLLSTNEIQALGLSENFDAWSSHGVTHLLELENKKGDAKIIPIRFSNMSTRTKSEKLSEYSLDKVRTKTASGKWRSIDEITQQLRAIIKNPKISFPKSELTGINWQKIPVTAEKDDPLSQLLRRSGSYLDK